MKKDYETWRDFIEDKIYTLIILIPVLLLLGLCTGIIGTDDWKCSDNNLTSSQERACDKAYEDAYEKKWKKSPYDN